MFRAALFDMDGLLIDSERRIMSAWINAAKSKNIALSQDDFVQVIGRDGQDSKNILTALLGTEALFEEVRALAVKLCGSTFPAKKGALALLNKMRSLNIPCAVATSSSIPEIHRRLGAESMINLFDHLVSADEVKLGKPWPDVYQLASDRIGIYIEACLAFEDSENGALAAINAGAGLVLVPDVAPLSDDTRSKALAVFTDLDYATQSVLQRFSQGIGDQDVGGPE